MYSKLSKIYYKWSIDQSTVFIILDYKSDSLWAVKCHLLREKPNSAKWTSIKCLFTYTSNFMYILYIHNYIICMYAYKQNKHAYVAFGALKRSRDYDCVHRYSHECMKFISCWLSCQVIILSTFYLFKIYFNIHINKSVSDVSIRVIQR